MSEDTTYDGWTNYPTWAVNLWLSNDEGLYNETIEVVDGAITYASDHPNTHGENPIWTVEQANRYIAAEHLKDWVTEMGVSVTNRYAGDSATGDPQGMAADIYGWALAQVNWDEIADAWIETYKEVAPVEP